MESAYIYIYACVRACVGSYAHVCMCTHAKAYDCVHECEHVLCVCTVYACGRAYVCVCECVIV